MCESPITIINPNTKEEVKVRCGKCILCRRKRCRTWALRLYHESLYHNKMCMITLTFRPKFLLKPKIKKITKYTTRKKNDGTKEKIKYKYNTMISPKYITDVRKTGWLITLFIKKLRKQLQKNNIFISYFAVGEHGTQNTQRAHWHILIFGIDKNTLNSVNIGKSKKNKDIYWSPIIDKIWSYDKVKCGNHTISDVTGATIKYVANYTMKKVYKENEEKPTIMRFSNGNKIGIKFARRYHKQLRLGFLEDADGIKYNIPEAYYKEMLRYINQDENTTMLDTAECIEQKKDEIINKMKEKGLLNEKEQKNKAEKYRIKYKKQERDTI